MKIAILYDSKYGNTKQLAKFMAEKIRIDGHECQLFRTTKIKPAELLAFLPGALLVGGPTHFGKPTRTLGKYIKKLGKHGNQTTIDKAAVFNCNTGDDVCVIIQNQILDVFPQIEIFEKSLPVRTGSENENNWKEVVLPMNWKEDTSDFISKFLNFL
ncbi:MAG: flavodoxin family protein [Candidatus Hermodarchaeota archaeon]